MLSFAAHLSRPVAGSAVANMQKNVMNLSAEAAAATALNAGLDIYGGWNDGRLNVAPALF